MLSNGNFKLNTSIHVVIPKLINILVRGIIMGRSEERRGNNKMAMLVKR